MSDEKKRACDQPLSAAQRRVLETAAARPDGYCCPTRGLRGAAQEAVLRALRAQGMITTEPGPRITDKGRSELAAEAAR